MALHETQQCGHRHYTWPHPFPTPDNASQIASSRTSAKPQVGFIHDSITVPPMTTKKSTAFIYQLSEWNRTGTVTPVEKYTEAPSLIISQWISTLIDKKITVRVNNTTKSPYTVIKNTQFANFSVVTPEQSNFIKPVDTATLNMIPEGDRDLTTYLSELLRTNKPDQQNKIFWFPKPKNPGFRKSWQYRESYPNSDANPQRTAWTATKKNWTPKMTQKHKCIF